MILTFALLPLALASFFTRSRAQSTAGFGFLAALAPVVAKGISSLISHKQKKSAENKQAAYEQQQAAAQAAADRAAFDAQQNSPSAALQRMSFNMKLGKLLGKAGGRDKLPASILKAYDTARSVPQYTPKTAGYVPKPTSGAGIWDVLGGAGEALSYLDTSKLGGGMGRTPPIASTPMAAPTFQTGQIGDYLKKNAWGSGTRDFG